MSELQEIGLGERLGLLDLGGTRAGLCDERGDLAIDDRDDLVGAVAARSGDRETQQGRIAEWRELRVDRRRGFLLDHQLAMQPAPRGSRASSVATISSAAQSG